MGATPNWPAGYVPTVQDFINAFAGKQDNWGYTPLNQSGGAMTGPLVTTASIAAAAGFNLPPGTAPLNPNPGDIWNAGTSVGVELGKNTDTIKTYNGSVGNFSTASTIAGGGAVMFGFGTGAQFTPRFSTRLAVMFTGTCVGSGAGNTNTFQLAFGTGAAPSVNAAFAGTPVGVIIDQATSNTNPDFNLALVAVLTGLSIGTKYWFDIQASAAGVPVTYTPTITVFEI